MRSAGGQRKSRAADTMPGAWCALVVAALLSLGPAAAALTATVAAVPPAWEVVEDESLFAVVTRKAGPAARFAHDHLVHPRRYDIELELDLDRPGATRMELAFDVEDLVVDDPVWQDRIQDRLQELGILDEPFQGASDSERDEIREEMLDSGQLDAAGHPRVRLVTRSVEPDPEHDEAFLVAFEMTVRDETRRGEARVRMEHPGEEDPGQEEGGGPERMVLEGRAELRFTDFGIEPYRAFLGAVRNQDRFFLYMRLVLSREVG